MSFSKMLEILKEKHKGKIVLIKMGVFDVATGTDAVQLHNKLNLKCTCFKNQECKIGFPMNALEKYTEKLDKLKYSYIVYDYDKTKNELIEVCKKIGKNNNEKNKNINCLLCKGVNQYADSKYLEALQKLMEGQNEQ